MFWLPGYSTRGVVQADGLMCVAELILAAPLAQSDNKFPRAKPEQLVQLANKNLL